MANNLLIEDRHFKKEDRIVKGDYENCTFDGCLFSDVDLSGYNFTSCTFKACNLSMVALRDTAFRDVQFQNCKTLGLHFENCNPFLFNVSFDGCTLNLSSFYKRSLKKTHFRNCSLQEVDFTGSDLSSSLFENCDLLGAIFDNTNLEKADLRTAYNYSIDPTANKLKKVKVSIQSVAGLLYKYDIEIEH